MVDGSVLSLVKKQTNRPGKTHKKVSGFLVVEPRPRWLIFYSSIFSLFLFGGFLPPIPSQWSNHSKMLLFFACLPLGKPQKNPSLMARPLRPYPPPPLELNGHRNFFFFLKQLKTDFDNFFSPNNFWTKISLFFGKFCNIQVKIIIDKL